MSTGANISTASYLFDGNSSTASMNSLPSSRRTPSHANVQLMSRAQSYQQQLAESYRNKGVICKNYFESHRSAEVAGGDKNPPPPCFMGNLCPFSHIVDGDLLPLPETVCNFYIRSKCLRDSCGYFHGSKELLAEIKTKLISEYQKNHGPDVPIPTLYYRPQDYLSQQLIPEDLRIQNILANLHRQELAAQLPQPVPFHPVLPSHAPALITTTSTPPMFMPPNLTQQAIRVTTMPPQFVTTGVPQYYHTNVPPSLPMTNFPLPMPLVPSPHAPTVYQQPPMYTGAPPFPPNSNPNTIYVFDPRSGMMVPVQPTSAPPGM